MRAQTRRGMDTRRHATCRPCSSTERAAEGAKGGRWRLEERPEGPRRPLEKAGQPELPGEAQQRASTLINHLPLEHSSCSAHLSLCVSCGPAETRRAEP